MKLTKTILTGAMAALMLAGAASAADAGGKHGHRFGFKFYGPKYHYGHYHHGYRRGCFWLKRKYYRTGHYHWLRKYKRCRYGY